MESQIWNTLLTLNWYKEKFHENTFILLLQQKNLVFCTTQLNGTNDFISMSLCKQKIKLVYHIYFNRIEIKFPNI